MPDFDELLAKIKVLNDSCWDRRAKEPVIREWLENFRDYPLSDTAKLNALYLLSQFMYFGNRQMRELMRVIYRDLFKYPIVSRIRKQNGDTTDRKLIESKYTEQLEKTRFLGVGNPSESGSHLLYYFRQENGLPKDLFIHSHEVFRRRIPTLFELLYSAFGKKRSRLSRSVQLRNEDVNHYVFIDDFCGSGHQGIQYSRDIVEFVKVLNPDVQVSYFVLIATSTGMQRIRTNTAFDAVECVFELDESFKCFSASSRYFPSQIPGVEGRFAKNLCLHYGSKLLTGNPLGYGDCQLLLGFHHNTPDNTLPIFWYDELPSQWSPVFKRYPKNYG